MKLFTISVFTALILFTSISCDPQLENFKKENNSIIKKIGCVLCQGIKANVVSFAQLVDHNFDNLAEIVCDTAAPFIPSLPAKRCKAVAKMYEPYIFENIMKLLIQRKDFLCGLVLKMCESPDISYFDLKGWVSHTLKDAPSHTIRPTPTGAQGYYTVLQINDIHIDKFYQSGAIANCDNGLICCRSDSAPKFGVKPIWSGQYGAPADCDIPKETFEAFLTFAKTKINPDVIMWLGDNEYHEIDAISPKYNLDTANYLAEQFKATFPDTPFWLSIGNHESFPIDNFDETNGKDQWLLDGLSSAYSTLLKDQTLIDQVKKQGFYAQKIPSKNLKIISLFGAPYDVLNFHNLYKTFDPLGQLRWLTKELNDSETNNEHVFIMMHIPFGNDFAIAVYNDAFNAIFERYQNTVNSIFSAHTHNDHIKFHTRSSDKTSVFGWNLVGPSLTTFSYLHPSFRVLKIDVETNLVVDYDQYRLDLEKWNANPPTPPAIVEWDKVYSFLEEYGLADMSIKSMQSLRDRLDQKDQATYEKYSQNFVSSNTKPGKELLRSPAYFHCDILDNSRDRLHCMKENKESIAAELFIATIMDFYLENN